jgi:hypothetical protein
VKDILHVKFLELEIGVIKLSDMNFFRKIKDKRMNREIARVPMVTTRE